MLTTHGQTQPNPTNQGGALARQWGKGRGETGHGGFPTSSKEDSERAAPRARPPKAQPPTPQSHGARENSYRATNGAHASQPHMGRAALARVRGRGVGMGHGHPHNGKHARKHARKETGDMSKGQDTSSTETLGARFYARLRGEV